MFDSLFESVVGLIELWFLGFMKGGTSTEFTAVQSFQGSPPSNCIAANESQIKKLRQTPNNGVTLTTQSNKKLILLLKKKPFKPKEFQLKEINQKRNK